MIAFLLVLESIRLCAPDLTIELDYILGSVPP